jgi:Holliday junction DNA helicase RuvA
MISHLRGTLLEKRPNQVIVDVHGVGYEVTIPVSAYSSLPDRGAPVELHIHTHVREDTLALFGFSSASDKTLFEKLITVSGIGPKLAVTALGGLTTADLVAASAAAAPGSAFNATEEDVISALMNFGAGRQAAEAAASKARSATEPNDFDSLFRRALKLVR